jgi:AsmA family protein
MRVATSIGLVLLAVSVCVGLGVTALALGGAPLLATLIRSQGSAWLGRRVSLGQIEIGWGRITRISADRLAIANASWGKSASLVEIGHVEMEVDLVQLLALRLTIPRLALEHGTIQLETGADGSGNWQGMFDLGATGALPPQIKQVRIEDSSFHFHNGINQAQTDLTAQTLVAEAEDAAAPIKLSGAGTFQQEVLTLSGELGAFAILREREQPYPVTLNGALGANSFAIAGTIEDPLDRQGLDVGVEASGQNIQQLLDALGVPIPELPIYYLHAQLHRNAQQWQLDRLTGRVGDTRLRGTIFVDAGQAVPYIRADLASTYLDLADLQGFYGGDPRRTTPAAASATKARQDGSAPAGPGAAARVIPEVTLPIEKLRGFTADFALDAPNVRPTAGLPFEHVAFNLAIKDGVLHFHPIRVAIAAGEAIADIEYRFGQTPPALHARIDVHHIDLGRIFTKAEVAKSLKQTAGIFSGTAMLDSKGTRQRQLLGQLDGEIGLLVRGGQVGQAIVGAFESSLAEALGMAAGAHEAPHRVNCLIAHFVAKRGVATAQALLLDTNDSVVAGRGNINLADETLQLDLMPYAKKGSTRRLGVPVEIRGTLGNPAASLDTSKTVSRLGAALGLGGAAPPAELLQRIETGLGDKNACSDAGLAPGPLLQGSSTPPR